MTRCSAPHRPEGVAEPWQKRRQCENHEEKDHRSIGQWCCAQPCGGGQKDEEARKKPAKRPPVVLVRVVMPVLVKPF